jgi:beta-lactamase regulating signal transducer with metallopeptidase domain
MTGILEFLSSDSMVRLGWALVHSVWQVALLALLMAAILAALRGRSADLRYACACTGLVAMLLLPVVTLFLVQGREGVGLRHVEVSHGDLHASSDPATFPRAAPPVDPLAIVGATGAGDGDPKSTSVVQRLAEKTSILLTQWLSRGLSPWLPYLVMAWLAGVCALSVWHLGGWVAVRRLTCLGTSGESGPLGTQLACLVERLRISRPVRLLRSTLVEVPVAVGWLRPVLLMPAAMLAGLSQSQLTAVLAHELAHIRRHDYLINLLQTAVETLLFYHPAAWWLSRRIRIEREHCCDDMAVAACGSRIEYASALAAVERARSAPGLAMAAGGNKRGGTTLQRVRRILCEPAGESARPRVWLGGMLSIVLVTALGTAAAFSLPGGPAEPDREAKASPPGEKVKPPPSTVWVALMARSPIRSLEEYHHAVKTVPAPAPPLYKPLPIPACDFEIRRSVDQSLAWRVPYEGYLREQRELNADDRRRIGKLPYGKYLVALCIGRDRCSNVAEFELDSTYDPTKEKPFRVEAIEPGPGQGLRHLGVRVTGPMIGKTIFETFNVGFPNLIVDGIARKLIGPIGGSSLPIRPGEQSYGIVDLARYEPAIEAGRAHTVQMISGEYRSDPAVISLEAPLGRAWDRAIADASSRAEEKRGPRVEAPATAWGASRHGLRAGIRLIEAGSDVEIDAIRLGEKVRPVCLVQNVSDQPIEFTTYNPILLPPVIRDARGRPVVMSIPESIGPTQPESHMLTLGGSLEFGLPVCLFASDPHALIDPGDPPTAAVRAGEGRYRISCEFSIPALRPGDWSGGLETGQLDFEILPPDRDKLTERIASRLRRGADHFALKVFYSGNGGPLRSLRLNHLGLPERLPSTWTSLEIDRGQVEAIIDGLAREGFLWRLVAERSGELPSDDPQYLLSISLGNELAAPDPNYRLREHVLFLGWKPGVRDALRRLRKCLDPEAATVLDRLIAQPELQEEADAAPGMPPGKSGSGIGRPGLATSVENSVSLPDQTFFEGGSDMRRFHRSLFLAPAAAVLIAGSAEAQVGDGRGSGSGKSDGGTYVSGGGPGSVLRLIAYPEVQRDLGLDPEQVERIGQILDSLRASEQKSRDAARNVRGPESGRAMIERMKGLEKESEASRGQIEGILTPGQRDRLKQISLQNRGAEALLDPEIAEALGLTKAQQERLEKMREEGLQKERELMESVHALPVEKRKEAIRSAIRKNAQVQDETAKQMLESVLDEPQKAKLKELQGAKLELAPRYVPRSGSTHGGSSGSFERRGGGTSGGGSGGGAPAHGWGDSGSSGDGSGSGGGQERERR